MIGCTVSITLLGVNSTDFTTPFIKWLLKSDYIKKNKLFLNAVKAQDNNVQIVTQQIADNQITTYVDGSKTYPITFFINNYKSINYNQLVKSMVEGNENVSDLLDVAEIIKFVNEMNEKEEYPIFSNNITVEKIYCRYKTPSTPAFDSSNSPALAKFTIPIVCEVYEDA